MEQKDGDSRRRQRQDFTDWLARNPDYTEYERKFEDLGVSGFDGGHATAGELGKLLAAIEEGFIPAGSVVLVEAMDRFSRLKPYDTLSHLNTIMKAGVTLVTLDDNQHYDISSLENDSLLYLAMKAKAAHDFSKRLSGQITKSYVGRAEKAHLGETFKRRNPFWLTSDGKLKEGDSVGVIRQAFLSFANGVPLRLIAIRHPEHFANRQSLKHALKNIAAIGHWQRTKTIREAGKSRQEPGELIKDVFDPAVTEELFYQVQTLLTDLAEQAPTVARKFSMAGLLQCGECGANMVLLRQSTRNQTDVVRCYRRMQNSANCTNQKTIPVPVAGWFYIETRKPHALRAYMRTKLPENQRLKIKLEGQIAQIEKQQSALWNLVSLDPDNTEAQGKYAKLVEEKTGLKQDLASLPTTGSVQSVGLLEFHRFMSGDKFATSNLLQLDGYRIICHSDGTLALNRSADDNPAPSVKYIGYARKAKRWNIEYPNGDVISVDRRGSQ
jgi:DNA invertase Pin-like site-specific DNA recombinase